LRWRTLFLISLDVACRLQQQGDTEQQAAVKLRSKQDSLQESLRKFQVRVASA
jgi:hypothetical protein